jgi:hypothetical protein
MFLLYYEGVREEREKRLQTDPEREMRPGKEHKII